MGILGAATGIRKKDRKKKPDELLSSVVRETAIPAALELLRSNTAFVFPSGTAWVMLAISADAIGGLSRRHGRDEAKGSIIELISSDQIKTVATAEMLDEEIFGIIPTQETLERMEEYGLLTGAQYDWAVVWQEPGGELLIDLVNEATFGQAKAVLSGGSSLEEAVGAPAWREHSGMAAASAPDDEITEMAPVITDPGNDDADEIFDRIPDEEPVFDDAPVYVGAEDEAAPDQGAVDADEPVFDETGGLEEFDEADDYGEGAPAHAQDAGDVVLLADQDQARELIARRFLSEDLDLDVRLDEFNATFAIGARVVQIELPHGATEWLGDQVAQLTRQANADLAQLRYAHEDELRVLCVNLMSTHAQQVIRDVATDRDGSRYAALKDGVERAHLERQSEKEARIREAKARIVSDYEGQAKRLAEQAAIQAEIQFKERNRPKMEREQADAVAEIDRTLENAHSHDQQQLLRVRRADAALRMQVGTTKIFEVLGERQSMYLADEETRLAGWKAEIQRLIDDNRKADIVQAENLAEHQRTIDEVGSARREHDAQMAAVRTEHAERIRRMEQEFERSRREAVAQMQIRDAEWQHSLGIERERLKSQIGRTAELMQQLETVEGSANRRWAARLTQLEADRAAYAKQLARASEIQGRSIRILVALMIALTLLSGLVGFISGAALGG